MPPIQTASPAFQPTEEHLPHKSNPNPKPVRVGMWTMILAVAIFLAWAIVAPLDEGVPAHGVVVVDTKGKDVQHLTGGIVKTIYVKEGSAVSSGQELLQLDDNLAKANHESIRQRYLGLRAMQSRLLSERSSSTTITFHNDLAQAASDPLTSHHMSIQADLLRARQAALKADLSVLEENIRSHKGVIETYQTIAASRSLQKHSLETEIEQTRPLAAEGYVPRNRLLELERAHANTQAELADALGQAEKSRRGVAELEQRKLLRIQEQRQDIEANLAEVTREVEADAQKLTSVSADLSRTTIRSPTDGQVMGLTVQTPGAIIQPGQKLMTIVPKDEPLVIEARIEPHLIDRIKPNLLTDVRFSAFSHTPQLTVSGKVASLSKDLLTDPISHTSYYLARIVVTPDGQKTLGTRRIQPGMPAEVVIKTGERSMMTYMLSPLTRRLASSLTEE